MELTQQVSEDLIAGLMKHNRWQAKARMLAKTRQIKNYDSLKRHTEVPKVRARGQCAA
jgi:hypothetical protein